MVSFKDHLILEEFKGKMKIGKWKVFFPDHAANMPDVNGRRVIVNVKEHGEALDIKQAILNKKKQIYVNIYDGKFGGYSVYITVPDAINLMVALKKLKELK